MKKFALSLATAGAIVGLLTGCAVDSSPADKGDLKVSPAQAGVDTGLLTEFYAVMTASCDKAREVGIAVSRDWGGALYEPTGKGVIYYGTLDAVEQSSVPLPLDSLYEAVTVCEDADRWANDLKPNLADIASGTAYEDVDTGIVSTWTLTPVKVNGAEWVLHPAESGADTTYDAHYYLEDGLVVRAVFGGTVDVTMDYRYGALTPAEKEVVAAAPVGQVSSN